MKKIYFSFIVTVAYNTVIACFLSLLSQGDSFTHNFIFSQSIGLSIVTTHLSIRALMHAGLKRWAVLLIALPISNVVGLLLALWITGIKGSVFYVWGSLLVGTIFGLMGIITYFLYDRVNQLDVEVKQRELIQNETEKREIKAKLQLLQAQIEPHFLFNTLANVSSLIEPHPDQARTLLDSLNDLLRVALMRTRSTHSLLGDELKMLENYLKILSIRFGNRLRWDIEASEAVRLQPFPPMLLQPLVENAVRHGIEPKIGGGYLHVMAQTEGDVLRIVVSDNGVGFKGSLGSGAGLENIKTRLIGLYGDAGKLSVDGNVHGGGVVATLELPL